MKKKELLAKIEDLESTVQRLRSNIDMQDVLIRQFQEREHKVIDTALDLSERTDSILADAKKNASCLIEDAKEQASKIRMDAKMESAKLMNQAETAVSGYRDMIRQYSHALERAANDASANAKVFAQFAKKQMHQFDTKDFCEEAERVVPAERETRSDFEDSSEDPGAVMRNIYRLQNRDIPEEYFAESENKASSAENTPNPVEGSDVPKVSDIVPESGSKEKETDLETLINEILNAGETNKNG